MLPLSLRPVETNLQVERFNREIVRHWRSIYLTRLSKDLTMIFILSVAMCATSLYIEKPRAFKMIFFGTLGLSTLLTVYRFSVMYFKKHLVWPGPPPPRPIPAHQGLADLDSPPSDGSPPMGPGRVGSWESVSSTDSIVKDVMNDISNRTETNDLIKTFLTPQQPL